MKQYNEVPIPWRKKCSYENYTVELLLQKFVDNLCYDRVRFIYCKMIDQDWLLCMFDKQQHGVLKLPRNTVKERDIIIS